MERVLVIGSNSFSGAHYVKALLAKGYNVTGISRSSELKPLYRSYEHGKNFKFIQLDVNKDYDKIVALVNHEQFQYIVNFASQSMVGESWQHPDHWYQTNTVGTVKLLNAFKDMTFIKKYVHISTPEVYGSCSGIVNEDAPFNPSTPYAGSRAACDTFIFMLIKQYKFPAVFTRAANVYGVGQQLFKIIPRAVIYLKKGMKIPLHGGGYAERSFIHIDDVCQGTIKIMENAAPGEIYHLSTDDQISVRDLVKKICEKLGNDFESSTDGSHERRGLDQAYILDSSKAKDEFGWKCIVDIDDGLQEVIDWIQSNWEEIDKEPLQYIHKP